MRSIKLINIENHPYYFFNGMISIRTFDSSLLNIDKISFKNTDAIIYNIRFSTIKSLDPVNIDCENSLYLNF